MLKNVKKTTVIMIILIVAVAGFLWYRGSTQKGNMIQPENKAGEAENSVQDESSADNLSNEADVSSEEADLEDTDFNALCENGEWMKIADLSGEMSTTSGKLRKIYPDDEAAAEFASYLFYLEGNDRIALSGKDLTELDYFEDREVEAQGVKASGGKALEVSQVRCAGKETDKDLISQRNKVLDYISANINSIAPKKAPYQKWTVDIVDFADENNAYVEYYDIAEDEEDSDVPVDTGRKILAEISAKTAGSYSAKVLAYWEMGEDDYVLKSGTDKFEDVEDVSSYQYDSETKKWERI